MIVIILYRPMYVNKTEVDRLQLELTKLGYNVKTLEHQDPNAEPFFIKTIENK